MHACQTPQSCPFFSCICLPACRTSFSNISSVNFFLFFYAGISSLWKLQLSLFSFPQSLHAMSAAMVSQSHPVAACRTSLPCLIILILFRHAGLLDGLRTFIAPAGRQPPPCLLIAVQRWYEIMPDITTMVSEACPGPVWCHGFCILSEPDMLEATAMAS